MTETIELGNAVRIRTSMERYQDEVYLRIMRQLNNDIEGVLKDDLGSQFVRNAGRDLAGEVIRNYFDTSNFNITVDQLARRILEFSYDDDIDPLNDNGEENAMKGFVYNYNDLKSEELSEISDWIDNGQEKLFEENRAHDKLDRNGKNLYREQMTDNDGNVYDDITGNKGDTVSYEKNDKEISKSDLHADHVQSRESASYNKRYIKESGAEELKEFWNSADNMQMLHQTANTSKGDVRVCIVDGKERYINTNSKEYDTSKDITYKATPEQLANAICYMWENEDTSREQGNQKKMQILKERGYLNEDGKVPKSVRKKLTDNIRKSQNAESVVILRNLDYKAVSRDAISQTRGALGKILAGQIIYYGAPPLVYELRSILKDPNISLDNALNYLGNAAKRIGNYIYSKLKDIFTNLMQNSLKRFIKSFLDILISSVKATIKKIVGIGKNLILATVDAIRIITSNNSSKAEKADAVFNLYGITITSCIIDILFEIAQNAVHAPAVVGDIVFGPLQILATVICTNLTILILKRMDLFDVNRGFKMEQIRKLFRDASKEYEYIHRISSEISDNEAEKIIENAKQECIGIYYNLKGAFVHMCG